MKSLNQTIHLQDTQVEINQINEPLFYGISTVDPSTTLVSIHIRQGIHILSLYIKDFPRPLHPAHFQRFIEKFLTDTTYRSQYLQPGYRKWEDVIPIRDENGVYFQCKQIIESLNQKETVQFKELSTLQTYGKDSFSSMNLDMLKRHIPTSFFRLATDKLQEELLVIESLRWMARGLKPSHAIYKVLTDKEVTENKKKSQEI